MYLFETITAGLLEVIKKELIGLNRPSTEASVDEITEGVWWLSKPPIAQR